MTSRAWLRIALLVTAAGCARGEAAQRGAESVSEPATRAEAPASARDPSHPPLDQRNLPADSLAGDTAWLKPGHEREARTRQLLPTPDGVLAITADSLEGTELSRATGVWVDGRLMMVEDLGTGVSVYTLLPNFADGGTIAVLEKGEGGNACPVHYYVLRMRLHQPPVLTPEFGNCSENPEVSVDGGTLRLRFGGYSTHYDLRDPTFRGRPDEVYELRGGRMARIALIPHGR